MRRLLCVFALVLAHVMLVLPTSAQAQSQFTINDVSQAEGNSGQTLMVFTVSLSEPASAGGVTFDFAVANGTTSSGDVSTGAGNGTILAGQLSATITIAVNGDTFFEPDEFYFVNVSNIVGATAADTQGLGTILNDDTSADISITKTNGVTSVNAGDNVTYTITVSNAGPTASVATVTDNFPATISGVNWTCATTGGAVCPASGAGNISALVTMPVGSTATFTATGTLSTSASGTLTNRASASSSAGDPDPFDNSATDTDTIVAAVPNLSIDDVTVTEGDSGTTNAVFTVSLSNPAPAGGVTFNIATADGNALAGSDYTATSQTGATIAAGSSSTTFTVPVIGETTFELGEGFFVNVTGVTNAGVTDGQGFGFIANDDPQPSLSVSDVSVAEGNSGTTNVVFTISLNTASSQESVVSFATADGSATQPGDYAPASGTLFFSAGQTSKTVTVTINGDVAIEGDETIQLNLTGAFNATLADAQGLATILNDDVPVTVGPASLPGGTGGVPYSATITASGGTGPYTFAVTGGTLPAGVTLSAGGVLSGSPTTPGLFEFQITATDSTGAPGPFSGLRNYSVTIIAPTIAISPASLPAGVAGTAYSQSLTASGGTAPYTFTVTEGALPAGLTLSGAGVLSGTPTVAGTFSFTARAADAGGFATTQAYSLRIDAPTITIAPGSLPGGVASVAYSQTFSATGGTGPYTFTITEGTLPGGLTLSGAGVLSGTPAAAGSSTFTVRATDSGGFTAAQPFTVVIANPLLTITPATIPDGTAGTAYSQALTASGGTGPYRYAITAGALPPGLTLSAAGVISGTPTAAGPFTFSITATADGGFTGTRAYTVTISPPTLIVTPATLPGANMGLPYSQTVSVAGGLAPYTFAVSAGALPAGLTLNTATGVISGTPTVSGTFNLSIRVTDSTAGTRATATVAYVLVVAARPDPAADREVRGLNDAQVAASRRFSQTQIDNVMQRHLDLHDGDGPTFQNGLRLAANAILCAEYAMGADRLACEQEQQDRAAAAGEGGTAGDGSASPDEAGGGQTGMWSAGTIRFGQRDAQTGRQSYDFQSTGITVGIDHRFGNGFALGIAYGHGDESQDVGDNGSRLSGKAHSVTIYGSNRLTEALFIDWLGGYQAIDFGLRRFVTSTGLLVDSQRNGHQWFGSVNATLDLRSDVSRFTPYVRLDSVSGTLGAYGESSGSLFDLAYLDQSVDYTSVSVGARYEHYVPLGGSARIAPRVRMAFEHDLERNGIARVGYADQAPAQFSSIAASGIEQDRLLLGAGAELAFAGNWALDFDYTYRSGSDTLGDNAVRIGIKLIF